MAHVLAGDAGLPLFASWRKAFPAMVAGAALACLPDVDYLPGLWRGVLNTTHQQATHSVAWVLLAAAGLWMLGKAWRGGAFGWREGVFLLVLIGSHLGIDWATEDRLAPHGIWLGWPFAEGWAHAPFAGLPAWEKTSLADLGSWRNLRALGIELGAGLAFVAGCGVAKRRGGALGCGS